MTNKEILIEIEKAKIYSAIGQQVCKAFEHGAVITIGTPFVDTEVFELKSVGELAEWFKSVADVK